MSIGRRFWMVVLVSVSFKVVYSAPLTPEEIQKFNAENKVRIVQTFDPAKIRTLVVGCDPESHVIHFMGGGPYRHQHAFTSDKSYVFPNEFPGSQLLERMNHDAPEFIMSKAQDGTLEYLYRFSKFETRSYDEAIQFASSEPGGRTRPSEKSLWEEDPAATLFVSESSGSHISGNFEDMRPSEFLKPVDRIIIEYYSKRTHEDLKASVLAALPLLKDGGEILVEIFDQQMPIKFPTRDDLYRAIDEIYSQRGDETWRETFPDLLTDEMEEESITKARRLLATQLLKRESGADSLLQFLPNSFHKYNLRAVRDRGLLVEDLQRLAPLKVEIIRPIGARFQLQYSHLIGIRMTK